VHEVLTGTLAYGGERVALATMPYRTVDLSDRLPEIERELQTTQMVLKLLPDVDNHTPKIAQLVQVGIYNVRLKGAWGGPAELFMVPHIGCPVAALPVVRVLEGRQHLWDMTLSDGQVMHDYLESEHQ
jgi:acetoacetate decarboxylase